MLSVRLLSFLTARKWRCISDWCAVADVKPQTVYLARVGRGLADKHVQRLAVAARVSPRDVLALIIPPQRSFRRTL